MRSPGPGRLVRRVDKNLPILEGLHGTSRSSGFCYKDNTDQAVMTRVSEIASDMENEP